jgi:CheY-like chemotaxis protein
MTNGATQKVVIINGNADVLEALETVLDAGHYDVVFVESTAHAYSQIRRVQPNLAIICIGMDDGEGIQVLSMLKLDPDTRDIPVITYTTTETTEQPSEEVSETTDEEMFAAKPALWMN